MIFQSYNLVERLTVIENVLHGRLGYKLNACLGLVFTEDIEELVAMVSRCHPLGIHLFELLNKVDDSIEFLGKGINLTVIE